MRTPELLLRAAAVATWIASGGCSASLDALFPPARPVTRAAIETSGGGWTRVSASDLIASGLDADAPAASLRLTREGAPIAFELEHEQALLRDVAAILFWAEPARSRWSDTAVYWLSEGGAEPGVRIGERAVPATEAAPASLRSRTERADEMFYVLSLQNGPATNFVWDGVVATAGPASKSFAIGATRPAAGSFTLTLDVHGLTGEAGIEPDHHVVVEVNGHVAADTTFDGIGDATLSATGDAAWLVDGANTVTVRLPHDTGAARDTVLVRSMALEHPRLSTVIDPLEAVVVDAPATGAYVVDGIASSSDVYDLADPAAPVRIVRSGAASAFAPPTDDEDQNGGDGSSPLPPRIELRADAASRYLLAPPTSARGPLAVRAERGDGVPRAWEGDELVIVTADDLAPAAERLAEHRRSQGIDVRVLEWSAVVDRFGEGVPSPDAIRALVMRRTHPRWLLLLGDASHDPKERLSTDEPSGNRIPTFFDDAAGLMESPSDNAFVAASAFDHPQVAVGRIPAATLDEADAVVDKLIAYDAAPVPADPAVALVADDGASAWEIDLFETTSESAATLLPQGLTPVRIYISTLGAAGARAQLLSTLAVNPLWVNYAGHGGYTEWAAERILTDDDIAALPQGDFLPVYAVMNCLSGHFSQPNWKLRSMGEQLVLAESRGAIAVIASTSQAYPDGQAPLDLVLVQRLLADVEAPTIGEAFVQAKGFLDPMDPEQGDVILAWHLLGDPSMRLRQP